MLLLKLKVAELRSLLETAGITVATKATKAVLVAAVEAALSDGSLVLLFTGMGHAQTGGGWRWTR